MRNWQKDWGKLNETYLADLDLNDESQMIDWYQKFYPRGSGPLGTMAMVCSFLEIVAKDRGMDPTTWPSPFTILK